MDLDEEVLSKARCMVWVFRVTKKCSILRTKTISLPWPSQYPTNEVRFVNNKEQTNNIYANIHTNKRFRKGLLALVFFFLQSFSSCWCDVQKQIMHIVLPYSPFMFPFRGFLVARDYITTGGDPSYCSCLLNFD